MRDYICHAIAQRLHRLSLERWGERKALVLVGQNLTDALQKLVRYAQVDEHVVITGESGVGKEIFANGFYLLSKRRGKPFLSVNCAQYQDENTLVSELFGHKKGSFTGAVADHPGIFEACHHGMVFLDEIGELSFKAQAMLLRVLAEGEVKPLGGNQIRTIDVKVVAATNRNLLEMVRANQFREDLYFRLKHFHLHIPPIRERGDDWKILADHYLHLLNSEQHTLKKFSTGALSAMRTYDWPGNVRELRSVVSMGYVCSDHKTEIRSEDFDDEIFNGHNGHNGKNGAESFSSTDCFNLMAIERESFWDVVKKPYLHRDLNRAQVRTIIQTGLSANHGSYKKMLKNFGIPDNQYLKFMDFLRHHHLKPQYRGDRPDE